LLQLQRDVCDDRNIAMEIFAWERTLAFVKSRGHGTLINFYRWIAVRATAGEREKERERENEFRWKRICRWPRCDTIRRTAPHRSAAQRGNNLFDDFSV